MKKFFTFFIFLTLTTISLTQTASDYFPQISFKWNFKVTPLDSASTPVDALSFFRIDSFASIAVYKGQTANIVESKVGPLQTIQAQPFTDSSYFYTNGSNGYEYLSIRNFQSFLTTLDQQGIVPNFSFVTFFASLQNWYSTYRFASGENSEYLILEKDTTVSIDFNGLPIQLPLQFKHIGTRLPDETIQTVNGNYSCKKFLIQWKVATTLLSIGDLITLNDSIWIAQGNWIVQDIMPGQYVNNLSFLSIPPFAIPGLQTKLTDQITAVGNEKQIPETAILEQNYPNPFNPSTKIVYAIPQRSNVSLKVYNLLGNEVADLVNSEMEAGRYETNFDASSLPSGVYFYKLRAGNFVETKKMLLLK
jgi:hypothetical protein